MDSTQGGAAAQEVAEGAREFLLSELDRANLRLSEIEVELRHARRQRDDFAREAQALRDALSENTVPSTGFDRNEAGRMAALVKRLSVMQRRDLWLSHLASLGVSGPLQWLYPHGGGGDPLTMLIVGSGGFGDVLCLTPIARALRHAFPGCRVFVLHQHPGVEILSDCPYVDGVQHAMGDAAEGVVSGASALDVFDLVADVRYAVSYTAPPLSRIPKPFLTAAHARSAPWQSYTAMNWPHLNNALAREAVRQGMAQLDLTGYTANLDVGRASPISLVPVRPPLNRREAGRAVDIDWRRLLGRPYATIHHGSDHRMANAGGIQTKNLPISTLERVVDILRAQGVTVAQLGESAEDLIPGDVIDLRGALAFRETAYVIAGATVHIDTEGGLVHAARAVHTPSVVAFGPTSLPYFAYPANANVAPNLCGDCWWTAQDWSRRCMRGLASPECMDSHDPRELANTALGFFSKRRLLSATRPATAGKKTQTPLAETVAAAAEAGARGLVVVDTVEDLKAFAASPTRGEIAVPAALLREAEAANGSVRAIQPILSGRLEADTDSLDWVVIAGPRRLDRETFELLLDAARSVRPGGVVRARLRSDGLGLTEAARSRGLVEAISALAGQSLGDAVAIDLNALSAHAAESLAAGSTFALEFLSVEAPRAAGAA